ncbi:unnamed protein product [Prorocentrum cordatum]|uniref:Uncharacterized protein n=1 Tax=Prorocentrum cordatum TaxID=2364126 RepID=A0ABN9QQK7_9DINO|nr:unnamed protein product [Polarella glacialis]
MSDAKHTFIPLLLLPLLLLLLLQLLLLLLTVEIGLAAPASGDVPGGPPARACAGPAVASCREIRGSGKDGPRQRRPRGLRPPPAPPSVSRERRVLYWEKGGCEWPWRRALATSGCTAIWQSGGHAKCIGQKLRDTPR